MLNRKKKYNYTPMTDEEIEASRKKLGLDEQEVKVQVVEMPQVLYGPPPMEETIVVEQPQVLYGPPPKPKVFRVDTSNSELEKMLEDDEDKGINPRNHR